MLASFFSGSLFSQDGHCPYSCFTVPVSKPRRMLCHGWPALPAASQVSMSYTR